MEFILPSGYIGWCHECGYPPRNQVTKVKLREDGGKITQWQEFKDIPGVGYKTEKDRIEHRSKFHDYRKG
jgi:hypothetical protein